MKMNDPQLESLLTRLGEARSAGAFANTASAYPWAGERKRTATSVIPAAWVRWARLAAPVAAVIVAAVVFGSTSFKSKAVPRTADHNSATTILTHMPTVAHQQASAAPATQRSGGCDYNGDGVVDGRDIQAFITNLGSMSGDLRPAVEQFQQCLLAS